MYVINMYTFLSLATSQVVCSVQFFFLFGLFVILIVNGIGLQVTHCKMGIF